MQEHAINLPKLLEGMSDAERTILWQGLTIAELRKLQVSMDDLLHVWLTYEDGMYLVFVDRETEGSDDGGEQLMHWRGEAVPRPE